MSGFAITLSAVRGVQGGRAHYLSAVPFRHVMQIFGAAGGATAELAQAASKKRVRELVQRLLDDPNTYALPPLIACIDGKLEFRGSNVENVGTVQFGMGSHIAVNDAGESIPAIAAAVAANPKLADDTLSVILIPDPGLKGSRQIFSNLARNAAHNSPSLRLLYDQRGEAALLAKGVMRAVPVFAELTETKKSSISNRSTKLFTLSAIHSALQTLFTGLKIDDLKEKTRLAAEFWTEVGSRIPAWQLAKDHKVATAELRRDFIHAHALALAAIARAGNQLLRDYPRTWKNKLKKLSTFDWSRANAAQWEGRAMNAGRLSKRNVNVILTGNLIKQHLALELSSDEETLEREFQSSRSQSRVPPR